MGGMYDPTKWKKIKHKRGGERERGNSEFEEGKVVTKSWRELKAEKLQRERQKSSKTGHLPRGRGVLKVKKKRAVTRRILHG